MASPVVYEKVVKDVLQRYKGDLNDISQQIWKKPEEKFEEKFAHELLTNFLEKHEFKVTRRYKELDTAFRAEFQSSHYQQGVHPTICVICEYDALPGIGHACGHNLIAEAGIAAGLAVQEVLKNLAVSADGERVEGKVVVMGTPAEEGGGGKVMLIQAGAFKDIDFAMMCVVEFHGKAAHASCGPWEGINALDAAVAVYQHVSMYRQQMKPNWRIHGIIVNGGAKPNIIPDLTVSNYYVRAETKVEVEFLKSRIIQMCEAAAKATGCTMKLEWEPCGYSGMIHCSTMSQLYKKFSATDGVEFPDEVPLFNGSTDMGDVSVEVPSIHPGFYIGQPFMIHTTDFQRMAGGSDAQNYVLTAAKSMALTCVELYTKKKIREQAKLEFAQKKKLFMG